MIRGGATAERSDNVQPVDPRFITTAFTLEGYRSVRNPTLVRGLTVRSRLIVGSFFATLETIFGGNLTIMTEPCERSRMDAFTMMMERAAQMRANAMIRIRCDTTPMT
jgi:uncharacterized protein YbjQ (UPF0145 family)